MTAPNIVNVATITGKTAVQAVGTSAAAIVTNSGSSNKVFKVNALYVSNVDGTNNATINVSIQRSGTDYYVAKTITVPADATLDVISKSIYLEEGDALRLLASAASDLEAVCSYEEIS
nr:putative lectin [uncultured Mediterranean phage uvMED]